MSAAAPARGIAARLTPRPAVKARSHDLAFWVTLAAILSQLAVSANLLTLAGISYNAPGGLPLAKFHAGTYLAILALLLPPGSGQDWRAALAARLRQSSLFALSLGLMLACALYALLDTGMSGTAVYVESYAAATVLGLALEAQTPANRRHIAYAMLAVFLLNALLCIGETALQRRLIPLMLYDQAALAAAMTTEIDFRGTALYDHPLTGAMMTMMAVLLCLASQLRPLRKAAALAVLLVALIPFGGRTAMAVTYLLVAGLASGFVLTRLVQRRMDARLMALVLTASVLVPAILAALLFSTPLGERIAGRFYADDSATVRVVQWLVLGRMDAHDWLFGMDAARLGDLMIQIGLKPPENDIENFWLLVFLNLGVVGFVLWLAAFSLMLRRLWQMGGLFPRLILLAVLAVASTSNSLGRKSNILFVCVAAVMTAAAFERPLQRRVQRPLQRKVQGDGAARPIRPIAMRPAPGHDGAPRRTGRPSAHQLPQLQTD